VSAQIKKNVKQLSEFLGIPFAGDGEVEIYGYSGIQDAKEGTITFLADVKFERFLENTRASAIIVGKEFDFQSLDIPILISETPYYSFVKVVELFTPRRELQKGVHPTAVIEKGVELNDNITIGANAFIGEGTEVGQECIIYPTVFIGRNCKIGEKTVIYPNVSVLDDTEIGSNVIIHSGTVIGSDGYGYIKVGEVHKKIPQMGRVIIEDNVEIGSNVSIDRATLDATRICKGTKIDNLVQIAHNVKVGQNTLIISQAGIAGSAEIGNNVILAGQVGVVGHIKIGDNTIVGSQSGVGKSLPPNSRCSGSPVVEHKTWLRATIAFSRLPEMLKRIKELEKRVFKSERED